MAIVGKDTAKIFAIDRNLSGNIMGLEICLRTRSNVISRRPGVGFGTIAAFRAAGDIFVLSRVAHCTLIIHRGEACVTAAGKAACRRVRSCRTDAACRIANYFFVLASLAHNTSSPRHNSPDLDGRVWDQDDFAARSYHPPDKLAICPPG